MRSFTRSPVQLFAIVAACIFLLSFGHARGAEDSVPRPEAEAIKAVIAQQLAAFRADDGDLAFSYASPAIQEKFGSVEEFMSMVRHGYEIVYRPQSAEFLEARRHDGITAQAVHFVGPDGRGTIAIYIMERQEDGSWRIDGVRLIPAEEAES